MSCVADLRYYGDGQLFRDFATFSSGLYSWYPGLMPGAANIAMSRGSSGPETVQAPGDWVEERLSLTSCR